MARAFEPEWLRLARAQIGTKEVPGPRSNPTVQQYYVDAVGSRYADSVAWCMAFTNAMIERAGWRGTRSLLARSALTWGQTLSKPMPGAIGVWPRGKAWQGHVGIVSKVGPGYVMLISGNQRDAVTETKYSIAKCLGWRWPIAGKGQPS